MGLVTETSYRDATARAPELAARVEGLARRMQARPRAGNMARAQVEVLNARRGLDAAKAARDALGRGVDGPERVREAAGRIAGALRRLGPESAAKLVQRPCPDRAPVCGGAREIGSRAWQVDDVRATLGLHLTASEEQQLPTRCIYSVAND
jgi:hypothetical protein